MSGPVERALRQELSAGRAISRADALRRHGHLAASILKRMVKAGVVDQDGDTITPRIRSASEVLASRIEAKERRELADAADAQLEAQRVREEQRRALMAQIDATPDQEARRKLVEEGRILAGARRHIQRLEDDTTTTEGLEQLFGIEIDELTTTKG